MRFVVAIVLYFFDFCVLIYLDMYWGFGEVEKGYAGVVCVNENSWWYCILVDIN